MLNSAANKETFKAPSPLALVVLVTIIWAGYFIIQMSGPPDLMDSDQERPASYIMDAVVNGNWIVQRDIAGSITSKPPLYTWLSALTTLPFGRISEFTLYLPCALATLGVAWLLLAFGGAHFGRGTGFWAAAAFLLTPTTLKQVALARTDPLFDFLCFAAAVLAFRSWSKGSGWFWYWLVAAAATLTKGPLGIALSAGGLVALFFERKRTDRVPMRGSHALGLVIFTLLTVGWFVLAYWVAGKDLIDKIIFGELVGQAVGNSGPPLLSFYKPPFYFLTRFAPWSILTCMGLWRVWRKPSAEPNERRLERFLACYFLVGLVIFSLASHTRPGLVVPLFPPAALLAGRELALLLRPRRARRYVLAFAAASILILGANGYYSNVVQLKDKKIRETLDMKRFASELSNQVGEGFPFIFTDAPYTLQFYLNTMSPKISSEKAAQFLAAPEAAFVVVSDAAEFKKTVPASTSALLSEVAVQSRKHKPGLVVLGNRPKLEYSDRMICRVGPIVVKTDGGNVLDVHERDCIFRPTKPGGAITVKNDSAIPRPFAVRVVRNAKSTSEQKTLGAGEIWRLRFSEAGTLADAPARRSMPLIVLLFAAILLLLVAGCRQTLRALQSNPRW